MIEIEKGNWSSEELRKKTHELSHRVFLEFQRITP